MAKNEYLRRVQAKCREETAAKNSITLQMAVDAAVLAANEVFGAGSKRAAQFVCKMQEYFMTIINLTLEDSRDMEYTKARIDNALETILGENFTPWDDRYGKVRE